MLRDGNILLVANYESDVGYAWWLMENFWVEIARHFSRRGRGVFLIYPSIGRIPESVVSAPITILKYDFSDRSKEGMNQLKANIQQNCIKSIYLTDRKLFDSKYLLLRKWGVRRIALHSHWGGDSPPAAWWKRIILGTIYQIPGLSCDLYIGVSRFVYERLVKCACVPKEKCTYLLSGIVPIESEEKNRFIAHNEFCIPHDSVIIVSTGRATFFKGIQFIIECADVLVNERKLRNVYFLYCGDGPDINTFKKMAEDKCISKRFIFAGKRSDVRELLQSCSIGMQASSGEAFSLSILEYMSAELAVLVPWHGGNMEAVINGETGILYRPGDVEMAVKILEKLVHRAEVRKRLGANAASMVKEHFDIRKTNVKFIELVDAVL